MEHPRHVSGCFRKCDGRQDLIFDPYKIPGLSRLLFRIGHDQGYTVAYVSCMTGQDRLVRVVILAGEPLAAVVSGIGGIKVCKYFDTLDPACLGHIDLLYDRIGMWAEKHCTEKGIWERLVREIGKPAADFVHSIESCNVPADIFV